MDKSKFNDRNEWRKFGIGLAVILAFIATVHVIFAKPLYAYFYTACLLVLCLAFFAPVILKPLFILFSYIGFAIGWVMTRVILTLLFYLVLTPIGLAAKIWGTSFLSLKIEKNTRSYWVDRESTEYDRKDFERQF